MISDSIHKVVGFTPAILVGVALLVVLNAIGNSLPIVREIYYAAWLLVAATALHYAKIFVDRTK